MADIGITAGFDLPFQEQVDFFRQKINLPTQFWDDIWQEAHDRSFVVAGASKADLLADLKSAVDKAITQGTSLETFRQDFRKIVADHGWTGWTGEGSASGFAWRTKVIWETNLRTSYAAGRWAQLNDPGLKKLMPYWRYVHADSVLHPRPLHQRWGRERLTLPSDHAFWKTHFPPNGWGCRCRVTAAASPRKGDATEPPAGWDVPGENGALPGIDKGFGYAPGAKAKTPLADVIEQKLIKLDAPIGAAMWQTLKPVLAAESRVAAFGQWVDDVRSEPPRGAIQVAGALRPGWIAAAERAGIRPATAEIVVRDHDVWHTFRDGKQHQLPLSWYKRLPALLDTPAAVVLDTVKADRPAFLLIYPAAEGSNKLVVRVNYLVKKRGEMNIVETGRAVDVSGIKAMLGHGYELIEGAL